MRKKGIALLLAVWLLAGLSGCSQQKEETAPAETEAAADFPALELVDDEYRNYYEIFVGSFYDSDGDGSGDLNGIIQKLDYIEELGFNGIWLTPIMPSPSYHKYDVTDYEQIDADFGTLDDYKNLVDECHKRNIRLIIDMVFNHTSSEHSWFVQACEYLEGLPAEEEPDLNACPYAGYYHFEKGRKNDANWYQVGDTDWYYEGIFWSGMPDLALENDAVRKELEEIADFWLEMGTDGFRLDAAKEYFTGYTEKNTEVLQWYTDYVKSVSPDAYLVAEVWEGAAAIEEYYKSGIDSLFNFPAAAQDGAIVKTTRRNVEPSEFVDWLIRHRQNAMQNNPSYIDAPFLSNHDTTRVAAQCASQEEQMKFAAGLLLVMPGSPFVYYGEEIGMKSVGTKDENKRLPMYWSSASDEGMTNPPADADEVEQKFPSAEEQLKDSASILNYYKKALYIRNSHPELARGEVEAIGEGLPDNVAAMLRTWGNERCVVICSTAEETVELDLNGCGLEEYRLSDSLTVENGAVKQNGEGIVSLPPYSIVILE